MFYPTVEEFARNFGVVLERCSEDWGGTWAYRTSATAIHCGFRTEKSAHMAWLKNEFGERGAKAILKLIAAAS
jgi:hypothetical protein